MVTDVQEAPSAVKPAASIAVARADVLKTSRPSHVARGVGNERRLAGEDRLRLIAEAAYFRAELRGFAPGRDLEDWLAAEIEVDALFADDES